MNYSVNLNSGQTVEVVIGEAAQINVEQALNYIESGRVEITKYVNEWAKPEITNYTKEYAEPIVTEIVNQTTKPLIDDYLNTTTKPQIDEYVADNVKPYSDSAQDSAAKAKISEDNAKTSETNAKASELAAASSAGVASAAAVTATEAKDYTAKVLTDENLKTVGQDLQSADSNIKTVATNIVNVNTVAKNIDNVNLLAPHTEAMEALAPDIMDVVTVAGITEQTKNVSENMTAVVDVSNNKTNINNVAANITAVNNVSENMPDVKNAVQSANDAKLWAVGTKTEKPEGSSKYWAEQAKNAVQTPDATETVKGIVRLATSNEVTAGTNDSAAITPLKLKQKIAQDLTNPSTNTVPSTKAVSDESSRITTLMNTKVSNCITEIPQDIKLELNNGTLTLKASSKIYVPNGIYPATGKGKFELVSIDSDISTQGFHDGQIMVLATCSNLNTTSIFNLGDALVTNTYTYSNTGSSTNGMVYLNTSNFIYFYENGEKKWRYSLPLAICTRTNGKITSIDQVFNGFGYIGSTVFALPGVKGRIPNGRNADGSLKSIEFVTTSVKTSTIDANWLTQDWFIYPPEDITWYPLQAGEVNYDESKNLWLDTRIAGGVTFLCNFGHTTASGGEITSFTPKTVFHALDYNDKSTISGWSMPSSRYIDLSLAASGSTYKAPANGYFYLVKVAGNDNGDIRFNNKTKNLIQEITPKTSTNWLYLLMAAQKGDVFEIAYGATGDTKKFRFIYAEGESYNSVSSNGGSELDGGIGSGGIESGGIAGGSESGGMTDWGE